MKILSVTSVLWISGRPVANATHHAVGRSNVALEVDRWATQLSISGNMIERKTCKIFVNN